MKQNEKNELRSAISHKKIEDIADIHSYQSLESLAVSFPIDNLYFVDFLTDALTEDLLLDSKTFDFAESESEIEVVRSMVMEAFDMTPADDIDFPEIYSRQRKHLYEDDDSGPQERMNDAFRILEQFPQIDSDTIKISVLKEGLSIYFRLKTGEELVLNLGGNS